MKKIIILASSGLDSSALIHIFSEKRQDVQPLYIRQGMKWESAEIFWLKRFISAYRRRFSGVRIRPLKILDFTIRDIYKNHWSISRKKVPSYFSRDNKVYLPGRNIMLLTKAAVFAAMAGIHDIAIGPLSGNPFPDGTPEFFKMMEKVLSRGMNTKLRLHAPFLRVTKQELFRKMDKTLLPFTFSCLKPSKRHQPCGRCNKCRERNLVFNLSPVMPGRVSHSK